ncbi:hypothetical protein C8B47_03860 [filamentous cyanobacterium CCP4]|nr:hypothetical protein C8B47_03860 [filamentous cyanobacterium CCP4]
MGQSYIDVYLTVQNITNEQDREKVTHQLANCSFWEESELFKQICREVTLSQHAWSRIAYIKLQSSDQEMFAGLIDVARDVVHNPISNTGQPGLAEPQPALDLEPLPSAAPEIESSSVAPAEPVADQTEADTTTLPGNSPTESEPEATALENPIDQDLSQTVASQDDQVPSQTIASQDDQDPVEQAMQELLSNAITSSTQVSLAEAQALQWGRGSGRVTNAANVSANTNLELERNSQFESLPSIA